jgi:hypothetical protein
MGKLPGEREHDQKINSQSLDQLRFPLERRQESRCMLRREKSDGVGVKRHRGRCRPHRPGGFHDLAKQFLVSQVDAIKVADGDDALLQGFSELRDVVYDLHRNKVDF